jgi:hypothetical protein
MTHRFLLCVAAVALMSGMAFAATTFDDFEGYADTGALTAEYTGANNGIPALVTSGGADGSSQFMQITDTGWSFSVTGTVHAGLIPADGDYVVTFYYQNGHVDMPMQNLQFRVIYDGGTKLATFDVPFSATSGWVQASTGVMSLVSSDSLQIEIYGNRAATENVASAFDQIILETAPLGVSLDPNPGQWLWGASNTITAVPVAGTAPYTQVEFDTDGDGTPDFTDTTAPFELVWDTSLLGESTPLVVTIEATVTDSAPDTASTGDIAYTVDNRYDGREELLSNGGFETWSGVPLLPDNWSEFQDVANSTPFQASGDDAYAGSYALGVNFTGSDYTNRYAMISDNLFPGSGVAAFLDVIISFVGKGSSCRMFMWEDTTGDGVYDFNTFQSAVAGSPVYVYAVGTPFDVLSDTFALATHQFVAGDHYWDEVRVTANQYDITSVDPGVWNLYH